MFFDDDNDNMDAEIKAMDDAIQKHKVNEDLPSIFSFNGECPTCGEELEDEGQQGECAICGGMCCYVCAEVQEDGTFICKDCQEK